MWGRVGTPRANFCLGPPSTAARVSLGLLRSPLRSETSPQTGDHCSAGPRENESKKGPFVFTEVWGELQMC